MFFLGYDPGGRGKHGVAVIQVSPSGEITDCPVCDVLEDAVAAWAWLQQQRKSREACALGIDTLLAWSPYGRRKCDDALRKKYKEHEKTVIFQNSLYSAMTLNGAMVAKWAAQSKLRLFESHPKLLMHVMPRDKPGWRSIASAYNSIIKENGAVSKKDEEQADHKADAVVAAWCAAQGSNKRLEVDLFDTHGDDLEPLVKGNACYPWFEHI